MDFATIIRKSGSMYRSNVAVSFEGREQTYGGLLDRASRLANGLAARGIKPQDRVAVLAENRFETVEIAAACALGNTPVATLYTYYSIDTNIYLLDRIGARVLIIDPAFLPLVASRLDELPELELVLVLGGEPHDGLTSYDDVIESAATTPPDVEVDGSDIHIIRFSSGTTGKPKGIYHTVDQWLAYNSEWRWMTPQISEKDVYLAAGSLAHLAIAYLWGFLAVGGKIVPVRSFVADGVGELIERHGVTFTTMVPTMMQKMIEDEAARSRDFSTLRCLTYAGSPISESTMAGSIALFGPVLHQMYAQSEVAPVTMLLPHEHVVGGDERSRRRLRSAGRPSPNVLLTIVDDEGRPVPQGEIGEVAALSPGGMSGLWADPEATAARLLADGSVLTRDMGYLDEDGFLFLADRKDDMIISGGYNIWPLEIEEVLASHPAVEQACVVGVPDTVWGETPRAAVVLNPGAQVSAAELIDLTRERLGKVKRLSAVDFVTELPVSGAGKIQRSVVRAPFWAGRGSTLGGA